MHFWMQSRQPLESGGIVVVVVVAAVGELFFDRRCCNSTYSTNATISGIIYEILLGHRFQFQGSNANIFFGEGSRPLIEFSGPDCPMWDRR